MTTKKILVVGGGISGLACAWRLRQLGLSPVLFERSQRVGGVIDTIESGGFRFDIGPQSFLQTEALAALIQELGIEDELVRAGPRAPRYILFRGRLVRAPLGPSRLLFTPLIGWRTKWRLIAEPLGRTRPPEGDESIAAFVRRKFGEDLLQNLIAPFISGVYAGDPERLSVRSTFASIRRMEERYGSIVRAAILLRGKGGGERPPLCNFRSGMITLIDALAENLAHSVNCGAGIVAIRRQGASSSSPEPASNAAGFEVVYEASGKREQMNVSAIVMATPADVAARLLSDIEPRFGDALARIEYASVAQVCSGYRLAQIASKQIAGKKNTQTGAGFGFLVPRTEHLRLLGTVWTSLLFPGRVPEGGDAGAAAPRGSRADENMREGARENVRQNAPPKMASFASFLGGATDPAICDADEDEIAATAHRELTSVLGITGPPVAEHTAKWKRALPQYNLGHPHVVSTLNDLCARTPGIFLAGNYLTGPSLGSCIEQANRTAEAVMVNV